MPKLNQLTAVWNNIKEFELAPIRLEALRDLRIALVGFPGSGRTRLALQMRVSPQLNSERSKAEMDLEVHSPVSLLDLSKPGTSVWTETNSHLKDSDLVILMVNADQEDLSAEQAFCRHWGNSGKKVMVFCDTTEPVKSQEHLRLWAPWNASAVVYADITQVGALVDEFVPIVLNLLPEDHLPLGRQFPLFRVPIAHQLINDTCYTNAAYAVGSGIAEVVPALNLPLNITDIIVLTKAQAFLAYRLGLLVGFSTAWQDYLTEFGSVIGSSFLWRQLARSLVGLIPIWGIIPKVAVAYAGTYVVGHTILQWYLTGRHLNTRQIRDLYRQALARGKQNAKKLLQRAPRPRVPFLNRGKQIPTPLEIPLPPENTFICPACSQVNDPGAVSCQFCGQEMPALAENN